ncbi:MAG: PrgI family protein [Candidatus Falkowbacteria bacterium]
MQQFTVPQFIDVESKIIGPLTVRQFLIMLAAAAFIFIAYKAFDFTLFVVVSVFIFLAAVVFAFVKVNGQGFHYFILNLLSTLRKPGIRIWNHHLTTYADSEEREIKFESTEINKNLKASQVAELSLVVDTKGRYRGNNPDAEDIKNQ